MAKAVPAPEPAPVPEGPVVYEPDEGMAISTVKVTRTSDAYIAVEHPAGWSEEDVMAALDKRKMDFADKIGWWNADTTTDIETLVLGENDPDDPHREPFLLEASAGGDDPEEEEEPAGDEAPADDEAAAAGEDA